VRLEIRVDDGLCMGAQRCLYLAPGVFRLNDAGQAEIHGRGAMSDDELIEVARQCPNFAIVVIRDGEILVGEE
jgi:ferredoxin